MKGTKGLRSWQVTASCACSWGMPVGGGAKFPSPPAAAASSSMSPWLAKLLISEQLLLLLFLLLCEPPADPDEVGVSAAPAPLLELPLTSSSSLQRGEGVDLRRLTMPQPPQLTARLCRGVRCMGGDE